MDIPNRACRNMIVPFLSRVQITLAIDILSIPAGTYVLYDLMVGPGMVMIFWALSLILLAIPFVHTSTDHSPPPFPVFFRASVPAPSLLLPLDKPRQTALPLRLTAGRSL